MWLIGRRVARMTVNVENEVNFNRHKQAFNQFSTNFNFFLCMDVWWSSLFFIVSYFSNSSYNKCYFKHKFIFVLFIVSYFFAVQATYTTAVMISVCAELLYTPLLIDYCLCI